MFREPKILPWLARKAGVPVPEAREIWQSIASQSDVARGDDAGDIAWRQVRELRRQLRERGRHREAGDAVRASQLDWMFPLPVFQAWTECQARIVLNAWLAWTRAARPAHRPPSCRAAVGS